MEVDPITENWTETDSRALRQAHRYLESPSWIARAADRVGRPLEATINRLPAEWRDTIHQGVRTSLLRCLDLAIWSLGPQRVDFHSARSDWHHRLGTAGTGFTAGAFGLSALPFELPVSTTLILRSIVEIAREEGHDLESLANRLECLEVFALGGRERDGTESGYWALRTFLAGHVSQAATYLARSPVIDTTAPPVIRFILAVAHRFGFVIESQMMARMVPLVGAFTGGSLNYLFTSHFQHVARGHFIVRRLEAKYGQATVQEAYKALDGRTT